KYSAAGNHFSVNKRTNSGLATTAIQISRGLNQNSTCCISRRYHLFNLASSDCIDAKTGYVILSRADEIFRRGNCRIEFALVKNPNSAALKNLPIISTYKFW